MFDLRDYLRRTSNNRPVSILTPRTADVRSKQSLFHPHSRDRQFEAKAGREIFFSSGSRFTKKVGDMSHILRKKKDQSVGSD
jgi:hypothetical protein